MNAYNLIRKVLFNLSPEAAHNLTIALFSRSIAQPFLKLMAGNIPSKPVHIMGLDFPNRVGLAAGLDKNADCIDAWANLGFGFIEVGTVTPQPQPGNPKPRLFRIPESEAIINRMGFNNKGIDYLLEKISTYNKPPILGVNIGKNKNTPNEQAADDYSIGLRKAYQYADYIAVNISSPNTPGLRELQGEDELKRLLERLKQEQEQLSTEHGKRKPIAIKIAPDIDEQAIDTMTKCLLDYQVDGLIVSNTTISRPEVTHTNVSYENGGLSGKPLMELSTHILKEIHQRVGERIPLIGVGGINSAEDAQAKIDAGASLVQIYSGFIYHGPGLIRRTVNKLNG